MIFSAVSPSTRTWWIWIQDKWFYGTSRIWPFKQQRLLLPGIGDNCDDRDGLSDVSGRVVVVLCVADDVDVDVGLSVALVT